MHRTGIMTFCSMNEYSTRYKPAMEDMHKTEPDAWRYQAVRNKQGSEGFIPEDIGAELTSDESNLHAQIRRVYEHRLSQGVALEQARKDLPLSNYTEAILKFDLHNLLHCLGLRLDAHAQFEIRMFAETVFSATRVVFPETADAWESYTRYATSFSREEKLILKEMFAYMQANCKTSLKDLAFMERVLPNNTEREEFFMKLNELGYTDPWDFYLEELAKISIG